MKAVSSANQAMSGLMGHREELMGSHWAVPGGDQVLCKQVRKDKNRSRKKPERLSPINLTQPIIDIAGH